MDSFSIATPVGTSEIATFRLPRPVVAVRHEVALVTSPRAPSGHSTPEASTVPTRRLDIEMSAESGASDEAEGVGWLVSPDARFPELEAALGSMGLGALPEVDERERPKTVIITGWMCTVCHRTPPPGVNLSVCRECRVRALGRYCSVECHLRDWPAHKPRCEELRRLPLSERSKLSLDPERGRKQADWLYARHGGRYAAVMFMAWKHRALSPVIIYGDPNFPHGDCYALPRVFWDSEGFGNEMLRDILRRAFAEPDFNPNERLILVSILGVVCVSIMSLQLMGEYAENFKLISALRTASPPPDTERWIPHYLRKMCILSRKEEDLDDLMAASEENPRRYRRVVVAYLMNVMALGDAHVRIFGLRKSRHLNGRVGKMIWSDQSEEKRFQGRHVITLDDGKNVGVRMWNVEFVETLTFSDKLDDLARKILDDPALPVPERDPRVVARSPEYESDWMPDRCSAETRST